MGELVAYIAELADELPPWWDPKAEVEPRTFEALQDAANALWTLWREVQIQSDLAAQP